MLPSFVTAFLHAIVFHFQRNFVVSYTIGPIHCKCLSCVDQSLWEGGVTEVCFGVPRLSLTMQRTSCLISCGDTMAIDWYSVDTAWGRVRDC